jgi:hypothetical protein
MIFSSDENLAKKELKSNNINDVIIERGMEKN